MSVTYIRVRTTCSVVMPALCNASSAIVKAVTACRYASPGCKHTIWTGRRRASCDGPISGHYDAGVAVDRFPRR